MNYRDISDLMAKYSTYKIFVGFSGGADSLALLFALKKCCPDLNLTAVHFNHNIRQESGQDAEFCNQFCLAHNIDFQLISLNVMEKISPKESIESAARRCRLEAWQKLVAPYPMHQVLLGHHRDDRCENFFLRLSRGSNSTGLTGLRQHSTVNKVSFLRPLLSYSRSDIENFLNTQNITKWCCDATNNDQKYRRNFIRHQLLPSFITAMPFAKAGINHAIDALECDAVYLEELAQLEFSKLAQQNHLRSAWDNLPDALLPRVLRIFTGEIPNHALINRLKEMLKNSSSEVRKLEIKTNLWLKIQGDKLELTAKEPPYLEQIEWDFTQKPTQNFANSCFTAEIVTKLPQNSDLSVAYFDLELLPQTLIISYPKLGAALIPFGKSTPIKIKKLRCDRKISADVAPPLLSTPQGINIWYPLIRHSNFATVTSQTKQILKVSFLA